MSFRTEHTNHVILNGAQRSEESPTRHSRYQEMRFLAALGMTVTLGRNDKHAPHDKPTKPEMRLMRRSVR